jgi:L-lactate dehydrogenase
LGVSDRVKLGIVGAGAVGAAAALAACTRGVARELVLIDKDAARAKGVATDLRYGVPLWPLVDVRAGDYDELEGAGVVVITAGVNEKAGGATDRNDPLGRLRLLDANVEIFHDIVPKVVAAAPDAVIVVVANPPEPLVEIARHLAGHDRVMSTSTLLDTQRFRVHLAERFGVSPASVDAQVIAEHGTFNVFLWSSARIGGKLVVDLLRERGIPFDEFRRSLEQDVRYANITIIEGIGASQYGIGMVTARVAEIILRDERAVIPVGSYNAEYGITLSLPSVVGREGVSEVVWPELSDEERQGVEASAERLKSVVDRYATRV